MTRSALDLSTLLKEAAMFADDETHHDEHSLYGVTDGKAVGTYVEHKFVKHLIDRYDFIQGNSALGIDIPSLEVDIKVTSVKQPQSSSPFKSARQKIYGLGYHLLVFVYEKEDNQESRTSRLSMLHTVFVSKERTADYQMTRGLLQILDNNGSVEDLVAFMGDKNLPVDDILATSLAEEILRNPPQQGYLTISNAQQWRLQYSRIITEAGHIEGITKVR